MLQLVAAQAETLWDEVDGYGKDVQRLTLT